MHLTRRARRKKAGASWQLAAVVTLAVAATALTGCEPYRIEYRDRPGFYAQAGAAVDEQVTLEDGTTVVYRQRGAAAARGRADAADAQPFQIREERPDGKVILRAIQPEHVLANTLTCLQKEEYDLIWEQVLSRRTRAAYADQMLGFEAFEAFFRRNRRELARTLMRLIVGLPRQEVLMESRGDGVVRCGLRPHVARDFSFTAADITSEPGGLKLLIIQ
jgi:hypothetical protein